MKTNQAISAASPCEPDRLLFEGLDRIRRLRGLILRSENGLPGAATRRVQLQSLKAVDALWRIAEASSSMLRLLVLDPSSSTEFPHLQKYLRQRAPKAETFPILFNELVDLVPYRELQIGYLRETDAKNPKKRSGDSAFSPYALQLYRRLEYLRAEQRALRKGKAREFRKSSHFYRLFDSVPNKAFRKHRALTAEDFELRTKIHRAVPNDCGLVEQLPPLSKTTAKQWASCAKALFKVAFPRPESISSLASSISDSDIVYESQIRSQIVERIGRAVVALAR